MRKPPSHKRARTRAGTALKRFCRIRDCLATTGDVYFGRCISCGNTKPFEELHGGHFMKATRAATEFDPRNVAAQCVGCNKFLNGNEGHYAVALDIKYGTGTARELVEQSHHEKTWTVEELLEIEREYKEKADACTTQTS